ncbi:unnamed protein product [Ectocarpus sp. 13 AM-2016]
MLRHDFGLREWDAPLDRLCPPVANRLNYICWLSDLMKLSPPSVSAGRHSSSPEDARRGVDVGTGASCIYPLLGARVAGWSFLATEIDPVSAEWAEKNVRSNDLQVRRG